MDEKIIIQQRPSKSPAAAGILSVILPGLGNIYNGLVKKGVLHLAIFAGLLIILIQAADTSHNAGIIVFAALTLAGFWFYQIIDSVNNAKAINLAAAGAKPAETVQAEAAALSVPSGSVFWGIVLMAIGALAILANFEVITWENLWDLWPVVVIVIGVKLVFESIVKGKNGGDKK